MNKITYMLYGALLLSGICLVNACHAEQLAFSKSKKGSDWHFSYRWSDHKNQAADIDFALPIKRINQQIHKRFVPDLAQQYVFIELHKAARKIDPREAKINIQRRGQDIQVQVSSRSDNLLHKWRNSMAQSQDDAFQQYLNDNHYSQFRSYLGQEAVKPDHLRYIAENKNALLPIAQAIYDKLPENTETRIYVNLLLSWVQSIPYDKLQDRMTSNGAGYLPPISVIANNLGDCDSKSVLLAALIRSLLPETKMVMIYLPNHALLGISLPFRTNEKTFNVDGKDYLMMEPTGPAKMKLGEISSRSAGNMSGNMFSYEKVQ